MEMKEVPAKAETDDKEKGKKADEPKLEVKTEEEADPGHYSNLLSPSEEVYAEAFHTSKPRQGLPGSARLYRGICVCLSVLCLLLLMVVVILGLKLQARSSVCSEEEWTGKDLSKVCNEKLCMQYIKNTRAACEQCPSGWISFGKFCYYLSTFRLTWDKSQSNCTKIGGSLAVITSQEVQNFLTEKGNLNYWIGLRQHQSAWNWVDNNMLGKSYWTSNQGDGDCALLKSREPAEKNWLKSSCRSASYYVCQKEY